MLELREMTRADLPWAAALEQELFAEESPWSVEMLAAELARPDTWYLLALVDGTPAGYAGLALLGTRSDPEFEIHTIGVAPSYQRQGVARAFMDNFVHTAEQLGGPIFLEVRTDNEPALALYRAYGFEIIGTRPNYYQPSGADAHVMRRGHNA